MSTQTERPCTRDEQKWADEYVERANYLQSLLNEERREKSLCEAGLREARTELRELTELRNRGPIVTNRLVAASRGQLFHRPGCHSLRSGNSTKTYGPCQYCFQNHQIEAATG